MNSGQGPGGLRLALRGVSRQFGAVEQRVHVLDAVDLEVGDGEIVCVIGPSGAGKTTLLKLAAGFESPDSGEVLAQGERVTGPGPDRCMVFQQYAVFPWLTVRKNIEFGLSLRRSSLSGAQRREITQHYVALMGLRGFEDAYPNTLSGGMQQRVAIGRAYAVAPEVLLMDEPFGALDAQTRSQMQTQLLEVMASEGRTVVFITHSVEEALYLGHRVVILSRRPAKVAADVIVPFDHPREPTLKTSTEFNRLRREVEDLLASQSDPESLVKETPQ